MILLSDLRLIISNIVGNYQSLDRYIFEMNITYLLPLGYEVTAQEIEDKCPRMALLPDSKVIIL